MLTAVDEYEFGDDKFLQDQYNVIVFSAKGSRPQCNKMSNGDLDGDTYLCIWDENLTESIGTESCKEPESNYPFDNDTKTNNGKPANDEIEKFLIWYFQKDITGIVNNLHLAYCDLMGQDGPNNFESQELAHLCNVSIDFGKHGEHYVDTSALEYYKRAVGREGYPDFMEKMDRKQRKSYSVLGQLYMQVKG